MALNDKSPMPYGKYKGRRMEDVPADYLLWLHENGRAGALVDEYIVEMLDALKLEIKNKKSWE